MDIKLAFIGFAIHVVFFASIFDMYFTSPLVHGMTPRQNPMKPPARRLVLFVADGLRADKLFQLDDEGQTMAPYLRNIIHTKGSWGVSHTRVPTESRPGHVALIAGFYEDVSAVAKGWKENPVEFDSLFNQSLYTWSWGSPDILPMFAKGAAGDHVHTHSYGAETEDFAEADPSKADTWVFNRVKEFFAASKSDPNLTAKLHSEKVVLFLHLLGLDTNGHSHKPYSKDYMDNIKLVDAGIEEMVALIENEFGNDGATAYVVTADHGMTNWGSHGAGHPSETLTPLVAWGGGVAGPGPSNADLYPDGFSHEWHLDALRRLDVEQADISPLMASLIGTNFPLNSVGMLPIDYLNSSLEFKAQALYANALQVAAQYQVKESLKRKTTLSPFFYPYPRLDEAAFQQFVADIDNLVNKKEFDAAILKIKEMMNSALDGLNYYQKYDRVYLGASVAFGYLGWMAYVLHLLLHHHTDLLPPEKHSRVLKNNSLISTCFIILGVVIAALLYVQSSPWMYYLYCLIPVALWHVVFQNQRTFSVAYQSLLKRTSLKKFVTVAILSAAGVETLVLILFYREVISIGLIGAGVWPLCTSQRSKHPFVAGGWFVSCLVMAVFPLLPVVGRDTNIPLVVLAGILILTIAIGLILTIAQLESTKTLRLSGIQLIILFICTVNVYLTWSSISDGNGLPWTNQIISWVVFLSSFFIPSFAVTYIVPRLLSITLAFSSVYVLLSTSHEALFCLALSVLMVFWLLCEHRNSNLSNNKLFDVSFGDATNIDAGPSRKLELVDLRCGFFFVFFILTAFFGTGNIASINSFDPATVYCFLTIFNPFVMGALLLWKIGLLFILVTCTFHAIHVLLRVPTASLFMVVLLMSDMMALHFFFLVRDSGSWLDIGTSISHYVIVMSMILFLNLLLVLSKFFTTSSISFKVSKKQALE